MSLIELFIIAVGLSMDAFAVAICKGMSVSRVRPLYCLATGTYFGAFQGGMPLIGYFLGIRFQSLIISIDHWIAFFLLCFIGGSMIKESRECATSAGADFSPKAMLPLAVATSIDALAIGVTFAFLQVNIIPAVSFIGVITFVFCSLGVYLGSIVGAKFKTGAELFGGLVLIIMGIDILLEHLGVLL